MSGSSGHVLRDEPFQGETPAQGVDVADANKVSHQQRHRRAPAPTRRPLLQRSLGVGQALLLHDLLGEKDDLPIQEQEPRQPVLADQMELFIQPGLHLRRHGPIAAKHGLGAEASQVAVGGVAGWDRRVGEGVPEPRGQVELALVSDLQGVDDGLGMVFKQLHHLVWGLKVEVMIGADVG